jgi:hypothetical protein
MPFGPWRGRHLAGAKVISLCFTQWSIRGVCTRHLVLDGAKSRSFFWYNFLYVYKLYTAHKMSMSNTSGPLNDVTKEQT